MNQDILSVVKKHPKTKDVEIKTNKDLLVCLEYITCLDDKTSDYDPILVLQPHLHIRYVPSKHLKDKLKQKDIAQKLEAFSSNIYIAGANFKEFVVGDDNYRKELVEKINKFMKHYPKPQKGLYIYGPYGTGKSYFLSAFATYLIERRIGVIYVYLPDLVRQLKDDFSILEKRINDLKQTQVLIIDDLGGEHASSWFRDEILLPILQYRLNADLPVFISSNLNLRELVSALVSTNAKTELMKSARLTKRIEDMCEVVELKNKFLKT